MIVILGVGVEIEAGVGIGVGVEEIDIEKGKEVGKEASIEEIDIGIETGTETKKDLHRVTEIGDMNLRNIDANQDLRQASQSTVWGTTTGTSKVGGDSSRYQGSQCTTNGKLHTETKNLPTCFSTTTRNTILVSLFLFI